MASGGASGHYIPDKDKEYLKMLGYDVKEKIGSGAYGIVFRGVCNEGAERTYVLDENEANPQTDRYIANENIYIRNVKLAGRECAIKWIPNRQRYYEESKHLIDLRHPNVVDVFAVFRTDTGDVYIITEFVKSGKLLELLDQFDQWQGLDIMRQLVNGLLHIHSHGLVHGDLHAANVVYEVIALPDQRTGKVEITYEMKIIDFGAATMPQYRSALQQQWDNRFRMDIRSLAFILDKIRSQTDFVDRRLDIRLDRVFDDMKSGYYLHMESVITDLDLIHPFFFIAPPQSQ